MLLNTVAHPLKTDTGSPSLAAIHALFLAYGLKKKRPAELTPGRS